MFIIVKMGSIGNGSVNFVFMFSSVKVNVRIIKVFDEILVIVFLDRVELMRFVSIYILVVVWWMGGCFVFFVFVSLIGKFFRNWFE